MLANMHKSLDLSLTITQCSNIMTLVFQWRKLKHENVGDLPMASAGYGWSQGSDRCLTPMLVPLTIMLLPQFIAKEGLVPN